MPRSFATAAATVQAAFAFQASLIWRGGPAGASPLAAVRQIGSPPGIWGSAVNARAAPNTPNGAVAPKAPAKVRIVRRENPRRSASGNPPAELLLTSHVSMMSLPKPRPDRTRRLNRQIGHPALCIL